MFSKDELRQIEERGSSYEKVMKQLSHLENGFPYLDVVSPATPFRGIKLITREEQYAYVKFYTKFEGKICKFVPASGAATRMFKELFEGLNSLGNGETLPEDSLSKRFIKELKRFAFYGDLAAFTDIEKASDREILESFLLTDKLGYGYLPKGLVKFHKYRDRSRTAFEEQICEASKYTVSSDGTAKMVMSVSPEHLPLFEKILEDNLYYYQKHYRCKFDISYTIQKPSTDTIAVDLENRPVKDSKGKLIFRPGGHGALIENLSEADSDIIVIKNIDNVSREELTVDTVWWKKVLTGVLLEAQEKIFAYLKALDGERDPDVIAEIKHFIRTVLCVDMPEVPEQIEREFLRSRLNRPLRVCGMVKNSGEPGGGPFLVRDDDGAVSLQILESAQLNTSDENIRKMIERSTHFNPVDLVCSLKDYKGERFDLTRFTDQQTGFVSVKSIEGKKIKALELPGLWNGAMSKWNSIFVEVPVTTFTPVKTVFDLLRPEHQG